MFRDKFCTITQVHSRNRRTNSQFLKNIKHEELKCREVRAQEILMTAENPMVKEQKLKEQICSELKELEREKFLEEKRKSLLHQNEDEIRQLDVLIKRAHIQRELAEQMNLKREQLKQEFQERLEENKSFEKECLRNTEIALEEERKQQEKKFSFRHEILKQMQAKEEVVKEERENIKKERLSMKRFLESVQQDMENERQHMLKLKEQAKQDRDNYLKQLELYKTQQLADTQEDYRKYMDMIQQRDEAKRIRCEKRQNYTEDRQKLSDRIGQQVYSLQKEKQKHDDFLLELLVEERLAKDDERYKKHLEKQMEIARTLRQDFQRSRSVREQEKQFKWQEEIDLNKEQLRNFKEQELKDKEMREMKLLKNREYCQELLESIEMKNLERDIKVSQNQKDYELHLNLQQHKRQEIEEEKLRLLRLQPLEILRFLPVKAISEEHRKILGLTCKETK